MLSATGAVTADRLRSSILRLDRKQNSYKLALVRALNDAALTYPDLVVHSRDVAVPLPVLAISWLAYAGLPWTLERRCFRDSDEPSQVNNAVHRVAVIVDQL